MSDKASSQDEEIFEVEWIEKERIEADGSVFYYIKWKDYPESDNTWEPSENLECREIMEEFEKKAAANPELIEDKRSKRKKQEDEKKAKLAKPVPPTITKASSKKKESLPPKKSAKRGSSQSVQNGRDTGFDQGLTAETIIGATDSTGTLMYLIKWKERNEASLVEAAIANQKCPQVVIQYLTHKITFLSDNDTEN